MEEKSFEEKRSIPYLEMSCPRREHVEYEWQAYTAQKTGTYFCVPLTESLMPWKISPFCVLKKKVWIYVFCVNGPTGVKN